MRRRSYDDRIVFNGHDLSALCMCRMHRPIMPPVTISTEEVAGGHGEHFHRARMDGYDVPVEIWLRVTDRRKVAELRHELASLLWCEEPAPLVLPDDPTRYHLAIVNGASDLAAITDNLPTCVVNFHVCDPIAYGAERHVLLSGSTPLEFDAGGTWPTAPVIESVSAGGTWKVLNVTTGDFVEVSADTFGAAIPYGVAIVCDMANERLTVNGADAGVSVSSDFFDLDGTMKLKVTGASTSDVKWVERWL